MAEHIDVAKSQTKVVLAYGRTLEDARARIGKAPDLRLVDASETADAGWVDVALPDAGERISELAARGIPIVTSDWLDGVEPRSNLLFGGPGIGSLAVAQMIGAVESGDSLGALERAVIREPGGRRVKRAASRRTPFANEGLASWALDEGAHGRLLERLVPRVRVIDLLVPGAAERMGVSELLSDRDKERVVLAGRVERVAVQVEIDREMRGDEEWEVELVFARGTMLARFDGDGEILLVRAPLRKSDAQREVRGRDQLLLRHLLAAPDAARIGRSNDALRVRARCAELLRDAERRRASRGVTIVLVHVPRYRNKYDQLMLPSLATARLCAYMRGYGYEVRVADLEATHSTVPLEPFVDDARVDAWLTGGDDPEISEKLDRLYPALEAILDNTKKCLVGFSIVDYFGHFQMNLASCLAHRLKERTEHTTVLGGERDQVDGDRAFGKNLAFDYVVDGDGETALYELAQMLEYDDRDASSIRAVWSRRGDTIVRNRIARSHLNAMPRPTFDTVDLAPYHRAPSPTMIRRLRADGRLPESENPKPALYLPYGFVKGCVADCTFCSAKEHLDVQAPEKSVDELLALSERHDVRDFVFLNNLVNLGTKWLEKFCRRLIDADADLQWTDSCRPTGINVELAHAMREAGCLLLNFGAESGSDSVLDRMKKGLRRADIIETLRATHEAGIINRVNLIAGYFHETEADVDLTISLVETLAEPIDVIGCFQGFYLFEGMGVRPEAENIVLRKEMARLKTGQTTLAYDEIGGLRWEEKRDRIDASRNRILKRIEALGIRTIDKIDEYDLFFISRRFRDKDVTRRYVLTEPPPEAARINQGALLPGGQQGRVVS